MGSARVIDFPTIKDARPQQSQLRPRRAAEAIVFTARKVVKSVLMKELKKLGIEDIYAFDHINDVLSELSRRPSALFVVDWEEGEKQVVRVLRAAQSEQKSDTRPIYFLAGEVSQRLVAIASDYNVAKVHIGEITPKNIRDELQSILLYEDQSPLCTETFLKVAQLRRQDEWTAAEKLLSDLVGSEPENVRAGVELGENYYETGDFERATRILNQMLNLEPENFRARHLLARVMMKQGRIDQAVQIIEDLNSKGILNIDRMVDLGDCFLQMEKLEEARQQYEDVLKIDHAVGAAKVGQGQCALMSGDINQAMDLLRDVANVKELASVFNNTAIICMRRKKFEKGIRLYKAAMAQVTSDRAVMARVMFNMGVGFLKWSKLKEAKSAFARSAELDPEFEKARHNIRVLDRASVARPAVAVQPAMTEVGSDDMLELEDETLSSDAKKQSPASPGGAFNMGLTDIGKDLAGEGIGSEDDFDLDDSYFQSLIDD